MESWNRGIVENCYLQYLHEGTTYGKTLTWNYLSTMPWQFCVSRGVIVQSFTVFFIVKVARSAGWARESALFIDAENPDCTFDCPSETSFLLHVHSLKRVVCTTIQYAFTDEIFEFEASRDSMIPRFHESTNPLLALEFLWGLSPPRNVDSPCAHSNGLCPTRTT
jgi:hypothetical protein